MTDSTEQSRLRADLWRRLGEAVVAVVIGVGIFYFWQFIQVERVNLQNKRQLQESSPNQQVAQQQLKETLQKHDHDIQRVKKLLVPKDAIGDFVSVLEQEAKASQIQLEVPDIAEDKKFDENHQPIPQTGPYLDVRLQVVGEGEPTHLLQFLYRLENLPYVVRVVDWDVHALRPDQVPSFSLAAPIIGSSGAAVPTVTPKPGAEVKASLILTMQREASHD